MNILLVWLKLFSQFDLIVQTIVRLEQRIAEELSKKDNEYPSSYSSYSILVDVGYNICSFGRKSCYATRSGKTRK
jgi:hypothetical protein